MAIDYRYIGQRIRAKRLEKGISQEKLSEIIGIGPSHMSHIENGTTTPSFEVYVAIVNALECSSDELLCNEIIAARPYYNNWLTDLIADCDPAETKILVSTLRNLKQVLRENK